MGKWGTHMGITQRNEDRLEGRLRQHTGWEKTASKPGFNRVPRGKSSLREEAPTSRLLLGRS